MDEQQQLSSTTTGHRQGQVNNRSTFRKTVEEVIMLQRSKKKLQSNRIAKGNAEHSKTKEDAEEELAEFIKNNFVDKKCLIFQGSSEQNKCSFCGKERKSHEMNNESPPYCYENAKVFGMLKFRGQNLTMAPFVRIAYDDQTEETGSRAAENTLKLLLNHWKVSKPELVLSIIGDHHRIQIPKEMQRKILDQGILNVIDSTNGWLITAGNNSGIAEVIAKNAVERQTIRLMNGKKGRIICIGVTPYGNLEKHDKIEEYAETSSEKIPVIAYGEAEANGQFNRQSQNPMRRAVLNGAHSHFLLVDNGVQRKHAERAVVEFRAELEKQLIANEVAVITVLIGGSATTIEQAYASVEREVPLIVFNGTGTVANLIGSLQSAHSDGDYANELAKYEPCRQQGEDESNNWLLGVVPKFRKICAFAKVVNNKIQFDMEIIQHLRKQSGRQTTALHLAIKWNRVDIAREIIENCDNINETYESELDTSIIENKVDFVKLLVDLGTDMSCYSDNEKLDYIYQKTESFVGNELLNIGKTESSTLNLSIVDEILERFAIRTNRNKDDVNNSNNAITSDNQISDAFHELMIYAVLFSRKEMAYYFWQQTERPLLSALIAVWLTNCLSIHFQKRFNEILVESYMGIETMFEEQAIGILDSAHRLCSGWASNLVKSEGLPQCPNMTLIDIAALGNAQLFMGHVICQREVFQKWSRGYDCNRLQYLLSFFLGVPILFDCCVRFDDENVASKMWPNTKDPTVFDRNREQRSISPAARGQISTSKSSYNQCAFDVSSLLPDSNVRGGKVAWRKKFCIFYTSSCSKFVFHSISYFIFLLLYSFIVLFQYKSNKLSVWEIILYIWQASFCVEILKTIVSERGEDIQSRFWIWYNSGSFGNWNNLDFIQCIIFFPVQVLRLLSFYWQFLFPIAHLGTLIALIIAYIRLFKIIFIMSYFGPKVIAIWKMVRELLMFFTFFVIFMFAYSVCNQSLIDTNLTPYFGIILELFRHGLPEIFGEIKEEFMSGTIVGCANYTKLPWFSTPIAFGCHVRQIAVLILLTIYMFVTSVLLMNMLIAVFAHIFDTIDQCSIQLWRYKMYFLVNEYNMKSLIPHPFCIFSNFYLVLCKLIGCKSEQPKKVDGIDPELLSFEKMCLSNYLERMEDQDTKNSAEMIPSSLEDINRRLSTIEKLIVDMQPTKELTFTPTQFTHKLSYGNRKREPEIDMDVSGYQPPYFTLHHGATLHQRGQPHYFPFDSEIDMDVSECRFVTQGGQPDYFPLDYDYDCNPPTDSRLKSTSTPQFI